MRIAAVVEDFNFSGRVNGVCQEPEKPEKRLVWQQHLASAIRKKTGVDYVVTVMAGDFLEDAFPAAEEKYRRAEAALAMGMDLVLELPVSVCLSDPATKAFSGLSMLKRLYRVDELVVLCRQEDGSRLRELADFMFRASPEYQAELKKCLKKETDFFAAQVQAAKHFFPEAAELLSDPINQRAIEILKARYQLYWMIKPVFVDVAELEQDTEISEKEANGMREAFESSRIGEAFESGKAGGGTARNRTAWNRTEQGIKHLTPDQNLTFGGKFLALLETLSDSEWKRRLEETPDGGPVLLERLEQQIGRLREQSGLEEMIEILVSDTLPEHTIRAFLMKLLIGIQRGNLIICGLRANCPYVRVLGVRSQPTLRAIQEKSWVPLLIETEKEREVSEGRRESLDECGQMLAALDDAAHKLYLDGNSLKTL